MRAHTNTHTHTHSHREFSTSAQFPVFFFEYYNIIDLNLLTSFPHLRVPYFYLFEYIYIMYQFQPEFVKCKLRRFFAQMSYTQKKTKEKENNWYSSNTSVQGKCSFDHKRIVAHICAIK